jgi:hypothetical protein
MINSFCAGHVNDFTHLTLALEGLEAEYDLGSKFEERESDKFHVDPKTGIKAWAEPLLVLYVSVAQLSSRRPLPTLRYGLTRSKFAGGLRSNSDDRERLLESARPHIHESVITLKAGGTPEEARDVVML